MSDNGTFNYSEMYDYDYNDTCNPDSSSDFIGSMVLTVLCYVLFCVGILGMYLFFSIPILCNTAFINQSPRLNSVYWSTELINKVHACIRLSHTFCSKINIWIYFTGNSTVLWVLLRHVKLRTMTDVCLLNLTLSDLLVAVSLPLWAHSSQNLGLCKIKTGVYQVVIFFLTFFL